MTLRYWSRLLPVAAGTGALLGAAQFGVLHGLGMLRLDRDFYAGTDNDWNVQMTWVAWVGLVATIAGAAYGCRLARRERRVGMVARTALSAASAIGTALTVIALTAPSARFARLHASFDPALTAALAGAAAVVVGFLVAVLTVDNGPLGINLWWTVSAVWVIAIPSFIDTVRHSLAYDPSTGFLEPFRLGVLDIGQLDWQLRARLSLPVLAVACALAVAWVARRRGDSWLQVTLSGAVGPTVVALAYLIGGPGISQEQTYQADAYLGSLGAVLLGLVVSLLVATLGRPRKAVAEPARAAAAPVPDRQPVQPSA